MNNEMPDDVWVDHSVMVCWPDGEQPKNADITRYVRADKAVPEGFKLVPIEPTKEMIWSGIENTEEFVNGDPWYGSEPLSDGQAEQCYKAMLSAAPQPPTKGGI